jgi:catalase
MDAGRHQLLYENTARAMSGVSDDVCQRHVAHCAQADPAYGAGVATALRQLRGGGANPGPANVQQENCLPR